MRHDFSQPVDLYNNLRSEMNRHSRRSEKIVWTARNIRDNLEAFEILLNNPRSPTIALCMGEAWFDQPGAGEKVRLRF